MFTNHFVTKRLPLAVPGLFATLAGIMLSSGAFAASPDVVGEVTTVIGVANLQAAAGAGTEPVRRGAAVHAGDSVETEAGGHVHIRFIDGGMVSVRPLSRLHIQDYRPGDSVEKGAIKFQLDQGVVRSVTGHWGEQARERFRLNTPVAAIGIKGTDFVVKSDGFRTQASVISGAIVMAPLDSACANSLGPCNPDRSALLSADMVGKMLEISQTGGLVPRVVTGVDLEARLDRDTSKGAAKNVANRDVMDKTALNDNVAGELVASTLPGNAGVAKRDRPLVWMQNQLGWNIPANTISERFNQAEAASRKAVVGNFFITLYRDESTRAGFSPPAAQVAFNLAAASASYSRQGVAYQPVDVTNGKLDVNFASSTYATSLSLAGQFGQSQFSSAGKISNKGLFADHGGTQTLAGAFSFDGQQAAYQFEQSVAAGKITGLTLWGR